LAANPGRLDVRTKFLASAICSDGPFSLHCGLSELSRSMTAPADYQTVNHLQKFHSNAALAHPARSPKQKAGDACAPPVKLLLEGKTCC